MATTAPDPRAVSALSSLDARGDTLATAESLTGGLVAAALTDVPGASRSFRGGCVTYASDLKVGLLGVPDEVVTEHGVVSERCARAMAEGARRRCGATYAVSTTGVAGPDRQEGKPVGTVFVAVAGPADTTVVSLLLSGTRAEIRRAACVAALDALNEVLAREEPSLG